MVMWLEREASIALPKDGDYFEDDYAAVRKTLRHRVMHVGGPYVKYLLGLLPGNFGGSIQPEGDGRSSGE
jgi:hypothetical protein